MPANTVLIDAAAKAKGTYRTSLDHVLEIDAPVPTETWHPIAHRDMVSLVTGSLERNGLTIEGADWCLAGPTGVERMLGVLTLGSTRFNHDDFAMSLGIVNSINKTDRAVILGGERVFVCGNLCFSGEFTVAHKHTSRVMDHLPSMIDDGIREYCSRFIDREREIEWFKDRTISDDEVAGTIIESIKRRAIPVRMAEKVWDEYQTPTHDEFSPRTVWSLQNAYTQCDKARERNPIDGSRSLLHLTETLRHRFPMPTETVEDAEVLALN